MSNQFSLTAVISYTLEFSIRKVSKMSLKIVKPNPYILGKRNRILIEHTKLGLLVWGIFRRILRSVKSFFFSLSLLIYFY